MQVEFSDLLGKVITSFVVSGDDEIKISTSDGSNYTMYHAQDCCESVYVEDINGDIDDIIGSPILRAEESTNENFDDRVRDSATWTFYKLDTIKGSIEIRWFGESNGYYSESVDFVKEK